MTTTHYTTDYEQILSAVNNYFSINENDGDEDWFYEPLNDEIYTYINGKYDEAKSIVDSYGIFEAIKACNDFYGKFEIEECPRENYLTLYCGVIKKGFITKYKDNLKYMASGENMKLTIKNQLRIIKDLNKENEKLRYDLYVLKQKFNEN